MGRSGSGKTTLLNLLGGLDRPTSGKVILNGHDTSLLSDNDLTQLRRHHLGFVFQSFALLPFLSALENVELTLRLSGAAARARRERAMECLDLVGLAKRANHRPYELSGGEQQRVAIARALAPNPALILADEPTGQLDSLTGLSIFRLFEALVANHGATMVVATHDRTVEELPYLVYRLEDGHVASATGLEERLEQLRAAHEVSG
jgi:ABC-type lipoprotein export system ATPase subunit